MTQFAYRPGLGTCHALLSLVDDLQYALDTGLECRLVHMDFFLCFLMCK